MTQREIVLANLNYEKPPRPAFNYSKGRMNDFTIVPIFSTLKYKQKRWVEEDKEFYDDQWGNIWVRQVGGCINGEIYKPVIEDWSQLDTLVIPDYNDPKIYEKAKEIFSNQKEKFRLGHIGGWIFSESRYLRKMETYFMDLIEYPEEVHKLNKIITGIFIDKIKRIAECGADGIFIGEDLGTQRGLLMSPDMWREFFAPYYKILIDLAHEKGMKVFFHSCGYNWELIDDLCKTGIDCFQFDQPALYDMPALAEKFEKYGVCLWSPLDIQKYLPKGDRQIIESEAKRMVEIFKDSLIINQYADLHGIGVKPEWDQWAYEAFLKASGLY